MANWILVYCKSKQDDRASENLLRQNYDIYRPIMERRVKSSSRSYVLKKESLFPGYIFVHLNSEEKSIAPISSTLGVAKIVTFGDRPAIVSEKIIDDIKSICVKETEKYRDKKEIKSGDEVYLSGHGFRWDKAIYSSPSGRDRSILFLNFLGSNVRFMAPNDCIGAYI